MQKGSILRWDITSCTACWFILRLARILRARGCWLSHLWRELFPTSKRFAVRRRLLKVLLTRALRWFIELPTAKGGLGYTPEDIVTLPRERLKIHPPAVTQDASLFSHGVEWDGVIHAIDPCTADKVVYLLEAALKTEHINGMPDRVERTRRFLELCAANQLPGKGAFPAQRAFCSAWLAPFGGAMPDRIVGCVGAHGFTGEMVDDRNQYICLQPDGTGYAAAWQGRTTHIEPATAIETADPDLDDE